MQQRKHRILIVTSLGCNEDGTIKDKIISALQPCVKKANRRLVAVSARDLEKDIEFLLRDIPVIHYGMLGTNLFANFDVCIELNAHYYNPFQIIEGIKTEFSIELNPKHFKKYQTTFKTLEQEYTISRWGYFDPKHPDYTQMVESFLENNQRADMIQAEGRILRGEDVPRWIYRLHNVNIPPYPNAVYRSWATFLKKEFGYVNPKSVKGNVKTALQWIEENAPGREFTVVELTEALRNEGGAFQNANISLAISDAFMEALLNNSDWQLVFPDTQHPDYDGKWDGDLQAWTSLGYPVIKHKTIKARELWDAIVESAWTNGEPGVWFIDRANEMSNSHYLGRLTCTNPCFEEPLPSWGVCCLGSLSLPAFIKENDIAWDELEKAIHVAVRFLDNVIDITPYFHNEIEKLQKSERRIGLGTMGLAEVLIRLGLRCPEPAKDHEESLAELDKLYGFIANKAYLASVSNALEKGRFPAYSDEFLQSGFMKKMPKEVRLEIAKHGIRNMTILTQAPTGSIATMVGTSTGIEPFFDWCYTRNRDEKRKPFPV